MKATLIAMGLAVSVAVSGGALAQGKSTAEGIAEYRKMLDDGNPAELYEAQGEIEEPGQHHDGQNDDGVQPVAKNTRQQGRDDQDDDDRAGDRLTELKAVGGFERASARDGGARDEPTLDGGAREVRAEVRQKLLMEPLIGPLEGPRDL